MMTLELAVCSGGVPVGVQAASGADWGVLRQAETGSWLGRSHQGRGIGTRMRILMLHLLFDGLGARRESAARVLSRRGGADSGASRRFQVEPGHSGDVRDCPRGQRPVEHP